MNGRNGRLELVNALMTLESSKIYRSQAHFTHHDCLALNCHTDKSISQLGTKVTGVVRDSNSDGCLSSVASSNGA